MNVQEVIETAIKDWEKDNSEEQIYDRTIQILNTARDEIIVKMAGFDNHWREWEVDHTNGRMSAISDHIRRTAKEAVGRWIAANIPDNLPKMNDEMVKGVMEDYKEYYLRALREKLWDNINERAAIDAERLVEEYIDNPDLNLRLDIVDDAPEPGWE